MSSARPQNYRDIALEAKYYSSNKGSLAHVHACIAVRHPVLNYRKQSLFSEKIDTQLQCLTKNAEHNHFLFVSDF